VLAPYVGGTEAFASPEIQKLVKHLAPSTTRERWNQFLNMPGNLLSPARSDNWAWALTVFIMFTGRKIWHRSSTRMAAQVDAHLSHPVSDAAQIPQKHPIFWEKHIRSHLQKRLFNDCADDPTCAMYIERISKKIKAQPKQMLWLLQPKEFNGLGIKTGHRTKFKQMMHSILHPAPKPLIAILKKTLSEREDDRYVTMTDIVHDVNSKVHGSHRLTNSGRWESRLQTSRRSTLHRFLGFGLLNKGYLMEAIRSFEDAGNEGLQKTVKMCLSCWVCNESSVLKKQSSLDYSSWTITSINSRPAQPPSLKKQQFIGSDAASQDIAWKASPEGEKTLRARLRECKRGESHFWILVHKAEACTGPQALGMLARILVVGQYEMSSSRLQPFFTFPFPFSLYKIYCI